MFITKTYLRARSEEISSNAGNMLTYRVSLVLKSRLTVTEWKTHVPMEQKSSFEERFRSKSKSAVLVGSHRIF